MPVQFPMYEILAKAVYDIFNAVPGAKLVWNNDYDLTYVQGMIHAGVGRALLHELEKRGYVIERKRNERRTKVNKKSA